MTLFSSLSIFDYIGFAGTGVLILAFTLVALIEGFAAGRNFLLLNILGSALLLFSDAYRESYASFGFGVFWIVVSVKALANQNVLDSKSLKFFSIAFTVYVTALLYHTIFLSGHEGSDLVIKVVSVLVVEAMMLSYNFLISKRIGLAAYLVMTLATKILFLPCLLLDSNSAAIVLHAYGVLVAAGGLVRLIFPRYFRFAEQR